MYLQRFSIKKPQNSKKLNKLLHKQHLNNSFYCKPTLVHCQYSFVFLKYYGCSRKKKQSLRFQTIMQTLQILEANNSALNF